MIKQGISINKGGSQFDYLLLGIVIFLSLAGVLLIGSSTISLPNSTTYVIKQLIAMGTGILVMVVVALFPYTLLRNYVTPMYIFSIVILVAVLIFGKSAHGSKSWFSLGFFDFQPIEIVKLFYIIIIAAYLEKQEMYLNQWRTLIYPIIITLSIAFLVLKQPDLSSTVVLFPCFVGMLYCSGVSLDKVLVISAYLLVTVLIPLLDCFLTLQKELVAKSAVLTFFYNSLHQFSAGLIAVLVIVVILFLIYWFIRKLKINLPLRYLFFSYGIVLAGILSSNVVQAVLRDYQRKRLVAFLNPNIDPLGAGYNIIQSQISVGSGQFFGKGLFAGTQTRLGFLPARHSDFIFSVLGEELGFFGTMLVLWLFFVLLYRAISIGRSSRDRFGTLIASGIVFMFSFYIIVNIGMTLGMMPIIGIPLPFLSYGGSALISAYIATGLLLSIYMRRFVY